LACFSALIEFATPYYCQASSRAFAEAFAAEASMPLLDYCDFRRAVSRARSPAATYAGSLTAAL